MAEHLKYEDLIVMETLLKEERNQEYIAVRINRDKSVVSRCISKNKDEDGIFRAESAWQKIYERKRSANTHPKIVSDSILEKFVIDKIEMHWSPEQIAGRWRFETGEVLCHETIYKWLRKNRCDLIQIKLRRKGQKYRRRKISAEFESSKRSIDDRPEEVEKREIPGHWEGDTMHGDHRQKDKVLFNLERKSGYILATKVENKSSQTILESTEELFEELPDEFKVSITYDNGTEFAKHQEIEKTVGLTVYFAHPYSPWERGACENAIGLLREFMPKGCDLNEYSEEDLQGFVKLLNGRPRKRLGFRTPEEVFQENIMTSCVSC